MMPALENPAYLLTGVNLPDGWQVLNQVPLAEDRTGSTYSVGYLARHPASGDVGFLKAFDYSEALAHEDPPRELERLASAFNAERDLLLQCGQKRLTRIVRALAAGTIRAGAGLTSPVSYLIFELADRDARDFVSVADPAEHLPALRIAHHAAVAMSQLHGIGVSHQDVKPSNVLVWETASGPSGKLGDLGCAHMEGRPAPHDDQVIAGDCSYAAPEQLYRAHESLPSDRWRYAADIYMFGSLMTFLLTGVSHSGLLFSRVDRSQHWRKWAEPFELVLPALVDAHGAVLGQLEAVLHGDIAEPAVRLIDDLCHPDPHDRGDAVARRYGRNPFLLERFVTRLDLLYRRALVGAAAAP